MNYNQYLYSCLLKLYDKGFEELEYDLQFELLPTLYKAFEESIYNDPNEGEYACMINYLTNQYKNK
jgi:hypothetical protein